LQKLALFDQFLVSDCKNWLLKPNDAGISVSVAKSYWHRFLMLVRFVDESWGFDENSNAFGTCEEYLALENISWWLDGYATRPKVVKKTGVSTAFSPQYITTLTRSVRALSKAFILPSLGGETSEASKKYMNDLSKITQKAVLDLRKLPKQSRDTVVECSGTSGLVFLQKPTHDLDSVKVAEPIFAFCDVVLHFGSVAWVFAL
jgi:hypothetical protein